MEKKQTAVQWLEKELKKLPYVNLIDLFEAAKEMEKEQIVEAYFGGTSQFANEARIERPKTPFQYYNETFNTK